MAMNKRTSAGQIALGGMLAALAAIIMGMGTLIPVATYVCPMLCILLLETVRRICGSRIAWAWYGVVSLLGLLFAPDKEAAVMFLFLGFYPILKPKLDRKKGKWLWKLLLFNSSILAAYGLMLWVLGLEELVQEFSELGIAMTGILLVMGNVTFLLLDRLLGMVPKRRG